MNNCCMKIQTNIVYHNTTQLQNIVVQFTEQKKKKKSKIYNILCNVFIIVCYTTCLCLSRMYRILIFCQHLMVQIICYIMNQYYSKYHTSHKQYNNNYYVYVEFFQITTLKINSRLKTLVHTDYYHCEVCTFISKITLVT